MYVGLDVLVYLYEYVYCYHSLSIEISERYFSSFFVN